MWTSSVSPKTIRAMSALKNSPRRSTRITSKHFAKEEHVKSESDSADEQDIEPPLKKRKRIVDTPANRIKVEYEEKTVETNDALKKTRRQPAKKTKTSSGEVTVSPPTNWERLYDMTKEMRKEGGRAYPAAVDTMGCERLADPNMSPRDQRFQTLISLMLSSQTKDTVTAAAIENLQTNLPGRLTLESILDVDPVRLDELIGKVGFHNNKTKYIKQSALILRDQFNSDIPDTITGLTSLPGVGPKMAYLCMSAAWGRDEGIGVDVHVHRITNLWGWHKTKNPEETRGMLEAWLPREKWHEINLLLVGLGQTICKPVGRMCGECTLAEEGLCPGSVVKRKVKREMKEEVKVEDGAVEVKRELEIKREEITSRDLVGDIEDGGLVRR